jgi:hypothetical protein
MATIVSCYYNLKQSKHKPLEYDSWIKNLLLNLKANIVIFTSSADKPYIEDILKCNAALRYTIIIKELTDLEIYKNYPDIWDFQELIDPNQKCGRGKGCYMIWNSKIHFMKEAMSINPYNSEYFIWNDIGNVRNNNIVHLLDTYPEKTKISRDKLDIVLLKSFYQIQDFYCNEVHFSGSMFGGHKDTILKMNELFYKSFDDYVKNNKFIGCDQQIIASIFVKNVGLFNPIFPIDCKVDPWFYLYQYYSS